MRYLEGSSKSAAWTGPLQCPAPQASSGFRRTPLKAPNRGLPRGSACPDEIQIVLGNGALMPATTRVQDGPWTRSRGAAVHARNENAFRPVGLRRRHEPAARAIPVPEPTTAAVATSGAAGLP